MIEQARSSQERGLLDRGSLLKLVPTRGNGSNTGINKTVYTVGVGEAEFSNDLMSVLVTYSLGSCLGIIAHDPKKKISGLFHPALPKPPESETAPVGLFVYKYVDPGFDYFLEEFKGAGCLLQDLVIKVTGGAKMFAVNQEGNLDIGKRNLTTLKKLLWRRGLLLKASDVGGTHPRTIFHFPGTGRTEIKSHGRVWEL